MRVGTAWPGHANMEDITDLCHLGKGDMASGLPRMGGDPSPLGSIPLAIWAQRPYGGDCHLAWRLAVACASFFVEDN